MAVKGQAIDGRNVRGEMLVDGIPQDFAPQITGFDAEPTYDTIESKILGESGKLVDKDHTGWKGTAMIDVRGPGGERFVNAYNLAKRKGLPIVINWVEVITYRDKSTITNVYPNVECEFSRTGKRGSAVQVKIAWETGSDRYSL